MSDAKFNLLHPYKDAPITDCFTGTSDYGDFTIVIEPNVLRGFLLTREKAMSELDSAFDDNASRSEVQPLYYSTQSFIDALMSVPKSYAISKKDYEDACTEYVAMKQFCTQLRAENLKLMEEIVRLRGECGNAHEK